MSRIDREKTKVVYEFSLLRYFIADRLADERPLSALFRFFEVFSGTDLWATDEHWAVLDFQDCLWIVPNTTPIDLIYPELAETLIRSHGYYRAYIGSIPERWAKRPVLGIPFGTKPRAAVLTDNALPEWQTEGPLDPRVSPPVLLQS